MDSFKKIPIEERRKDAQKILEKCPGRYPLFVYKHPNSKARVLDKNKFIVPGHLSLPLLSLTVKKRLGMNRDESLYFFINDTLYPSNYFVEKIYNLYKSEDDFLYVAYDIESTFG